jgi:hypothetical protein
MARDVRRLSTRLSTPLGKTEVLTPSASAIALQATPPEDPMPSHSPDSLPTVSAKDAGEKGPPAQLPLGAAGGVRVILEGSDFAAVEAAAAEMKVRFGSRFSVTGRRLGADRQVLRISAGLLVTMDIDTHAAGVRQLALPAASDTVPRTVGRNRVC